VDTERLEDLISQVEEKEAEIAKLRAELIAIQTGVGRVMNVKYSSNNSGGKWWLKDDDWKNLERAGWKVRWFKNDKSWQGWHPGDERFLGGLAMEATRYGVTMDYAIEEWSRITGQDPEAKGCPCCGAPHSFYEAWEKDE
jgi:hypothetical protein